MAKYVAPWRGNGSPEICLGDGYLILTGAMVKSVGFKGFNYSWGYIYIYMWSLPLQDLDFQLSTGFYSIKCFFFASNIFIKFKVLDQSGWPCTFLLLIFNIICLALYNTQYIIKVYETCVYDICEDEARNEHYIVLHFL